MEIYWKDTMNSDSATRKLVAVMHADVKGYSRLMNENEVDTVRTLTSYKELLANSVTAHRGRVVDMAGDGFLVEFNSVVDALLCAVEFQKETGVRNQILPENRRMEFRIGLNVGEVIQQGQQIFGDGVNIAARLEAIAEPGGICISGEAYDQLKRKLELEFQFLGEKSVKNISEPVRAYRVVVDGQPKTVTQKNTRSHGFKSTNYFWLLIALLVVVIVILAFLAFQKGWKRGQGKNRATGVNVGQTIKNPVLQEALQPVPFSLAVLPGAKSNDSQNQNIGYGLASVVADQLEAIPELKVVSSQSTFTVTDAKPDRISWARKHSIQYILETGLIFDKDKVTGVLNIFDVFKNSLIDSSTFDLDTADLWKIPNLIVSKAMLSMREQGLKSETKLLPGQTFNTVDGKNFRLFLEAAANMDAQTRTGNETAIRLLSDITQSDPGFAPALAELAQAYVSEVTRQWTETPRKSLEQAYDLSIKALKLNDSISTPYRVISFINVQKRQYSEAVQNAKKALELSPGSSEALESLGLALTFSGQSQEAIPYLEKAILLNPETSARCLAILGHAYMGSGDYDGSIDAFKRALDLEPNSPFILSFLAASYVLADRMTEARATTQELMRIAPGFNLDNLKKRLPFKDPAQGAKIIDSLNRAGLGRSDP